MATNVTRHLPDYKGCCVSGIVCGHLGGWQPIKSIFCCQKVESLLLQLIQKSARYFIVKKLSHYFVICPKIKSSLVVKNQLNILQPIQKSKLTYSVAKNVKLIFIWKSSQYNVETYVTCHNKIENTAHGWPQVMNADASQRKCLSMDCYEKRWALRVKQYTSS